MAVPNKAVKTITVSGVTGKLISATPFKGREVESDEIAAFGDTEFSTVPRPVAKFSQFKFVVLDEGGQSALSALAGTSAAVSVSVTYWDGKTTDSAVTAFSGDMVILSAVPGGEIEVDGSRRATIEVTAVPQAAAAAQSSNT